MSQEDVKDGPERAYAMKRLEEKVEVLEEEVRSLKAARKFDRARELVSIFNDLQDGGKAMLFVATLALSAVAVATPIIATLGYFGYFNR